MHTACTFAEAVQRNVFLEKTHSQHQPLIFINGIVFLNNTFKSGFGTGVPCSGHWANPLATAGTDSIAQCPSVATSRLINKKQLALSAFEIPDLPYLRYLGW
jgi:hypothetical protein